MLHIRQFFEIVEVIEERFCKLLLSSPRFNISIYIMLIVYQNIVPYYCTLIFLIIIVTYILKLGPWFGFNNGSKMCTLTK